MKTNVVIYVLFLLLCGCFSRSEFSTVHFTDVEGNKTKFPQPPFILLQVTMWDEASLEELKELKEVKIPVFVMVYDEKNPRYVRQIKYTYGYSYTFILAEKNPTISQKVPKMVPQIYVFSKKKVYHFVGFTKKEDLKKYVPFKEN